MVKLRTDEIQKVYYGTQEVCDILNERVGLSGVNAVAPSALRYYGKVSKEMAASKITRRGHRRYRKVEIENLIRYVRAMKTGFFTEAGGLAILQGRIEVTVTEIGVGKELNLLST